MRRLKAKVISTAMTFFWAVQAFAAEPKTEKIEVTLDIPPNPFLDQLCVVANYLTIGAIICSFVFGGIWLMQKKDAREDEDEDDDEEIVVPQANSAKTTEVLPAEPSKTELKEETKPSAEVKVEEPKVEEPKVEETKVEETKVEETKVDNKPEESKEEKSSENQAPAATEASKAEKSGTAKKTRKSKKKE